MSFIYLGGLLIAIALAIVSALVTYFGKQISKRIWGLPALSKGARAEFNKPAHDSANLKPDSNDPIRSISTLGIGLWLLFSLLVIFAVLIGNRQHLSLEMHNFMASIRPASEISDSTIATENIRPSDFAESAWWQKLFGALLISIFIFPILAPSVPLLFMGGTSIVVISLLFPFGFFFARGDFATELCTLFYIRF